jgi:hypothetical protein
VVGILFVLPDLTVKCPQVISRILFYIAMVFNLDCDFEYYYRGKATN